MVTTRETVRLCINLIIMLLHLPTLICGFKVRPVDTFLSVCLVRFHVLILLKMVVYDVIHMFNDMAKNGMLSLRLPSVVSKQKNKKRALFSVSGLGR